MFFHDAHPPYELYSGRFFDYSIRAALCQPLFLFKFQNSWVLKISFITVTLLAGSASVRVTVHPPCVILSASEGSFDESIEKDKILRHFVPQNDSG